MKIQNIIDVLDLFDEELDYCIKRLEDNQNIECLTVSIYNNYKWEELKNFYFNVKTGYVIPKYEKKKKLEEKIKKLQEELKQIEELENLE